MCRGTYLVKHYHTMHLVILAITLTGTGNLFHLFFRCRKGSKQGSSFRIYNHSVTRQDERIRYWNKHTIFTTCAIISIIGYNEVGFDFMLRHDNHSNAWCTVCGLPCSFQVLHTT